MSDTFITIIAIAAIAVLMFALPMMSTTGQNDEITESTIKAMVEEFVDKESSQGKITMADYDAFIQKLNATGNTYEVEMEVQVMGDNVGVKGSAGKVVNTVGENIYYSEFTNGIINAMSTSEKEQYLLKKGDYFIVSVKNTNVTLGKKLEVFFYQVAGKEASTIKSSASALVSITGVE